MTVDTKKLSEDVKNFSKKIEELRKLVGVFIQEAVDWYLPLVRQEYELLGYSPYDYDVYPRTSRISNWYFDTKDNILIESPETFKITEYGISYNKMFHIPIDIVLDVGTARQDYKDKINKIKQINEEIKPVTFSELQVGDYFYPYGILSVRYQKCDITTFDSVVLYNSYGTKHGLCYNAVSDYGHKQYFDSDDAVVKYGKKKNDIPEQELRECYCTQKKSTKDD